MQSSMAQTNGSPGFPGRFKDLSEYQLRIALKTLSRLNKVIIIVTLIFAIPGSTTGPLFNECKGINLGWAIQYRETLTDEYIYDRADSRSASRAYRGLLEEKGVHAEVTDLTIIGLEYHTSDPKYTMYHVFVQREGGHPITNLKHTEKILRREWMHSLDEGKGHPLHYIYELADQYLDQNMEHCPGS